MPFLFSNKFQLPKYSARKKLSFHSERELKPKDHPVVVQLDGEAAEFVRGKWIPGNYKNFLMKDKKNF